MMGTTMYQKVRASWILSRRATAAAIAVGWVITAIVSTPVAKSDSPCTLTDPYPPGSNMVCTGYGMWCTVNPICTPIYGVPGTNGPGGYTYACSTAQCERERV